MIKYIISILLIFSFLIASSQLPSGFPTQANTGWTQWGYQQSTLGTIIATRDTLWTPRYCGTEVLWPHAGVDTAYWMWDCVHWKKIVTASDISIITANNGLTKTGNNIQLGGTLVQSTPITVGTNDLSIVAANGTTSTTRFTIDNTNTVISGRYEDFSSINTIYTNQDNIQIVSTQPTGARRILIDSTTGITIGENVSGVYKGIIFKKGTSQLQANGYTGSTFQTIDTSFNSLVVDGSGNIFKRAGGSGGSADSSIFSTNFRRDTAVLDIRKHYPKVYNIVDYGAKGDGKENTTASISSSSATLTCTTCGFTSADVGKWIRINRAGVSSQDLVTTIITFTNSTTVTINTTASTSVSADTVIWGTNNVPFIQSALNDANNNGGDGIVLIPPPGNGNFYVLGGNLDHSGGDCNCQIKIPVAGVRDTSFNHRKSIIIDGLVPPNHTPSALFADTTTPKENTTLVSIIHGSGTRPSVFSSIDTSFLFANGINYNLITIKNIALFVERNRTGGGPDIGGINFYNMSSSPLENVVVGINGPIHGTQQPTNEVAGIIAGQLSSEIYTSMKDVSVFGFKYGLVLTEAVSLDHVIAHACVNGLTMIHGNYPVVGGYVDAHWCKNSVYVPQSTILGNISPGLTYFNFQNLALEVFQGSSLGAPAWLNYTYIISDSGDNGRGHIYGYTLGHAEVGIDNSMFNKFGGDSIFVYQTGSAVDRNTHIYAGLTQYAGWQNGGLTNYWYNWSPLNDVSIMRLSPVSPGSQAIYLSPNSTGGSGGVPKSWINLFNTALWTGVNTTSSNTELLQIAAAGTSGYNITSAQSGSGTIRDINIGNSNFTTQLKIGATGSTSINTTADDAFVVNGNSSNRSSVVINDANANGNASLYVQNDRGSFASYGGMLIGGSSIASTLFGLTRADKTFLIHDGANGLGMAVGTLQSTPLILGTNNSERFRIDGSTGQLKAAAYGTGVLSGTPAYSPQFDASGNILEKPIPYSLYYSDTSATTVTNTTTETSIVGNVIGSTSFNGGLLIPGSVIRLKGYGYLSTDATPGNLTINFIVSNFTLGITISTLLPAGITNSDIDYEFEVTPFGLGTNQDMFYIGKIDIVNNTTGALVTQRFQGKGQITTTGTLSTDVTAKWSTASTNNILNDRNNVLEIRRIQ